MISLATGDQDRAEAVIAAAVEQAGHRGVRLPDDLLIWSLETAPGRCLQRRSVGDGSVPLARLRGEPQELSEVLEAATPTNQRRVNGLHVTPAWLADKLVALALEGIAAPSGGAAGGIARPDPTFCDPACGGGAFVLAAARALHLRGVSRRDVVRRCLWGADIDPVGLAAAEAALTIWAGVRPPVGRFVVGDTLKSGAGLWPDAPRAGFDAVVGNPPFLNQLATATARSTTERQLLRERFGGAVRPYTDTAWLFLLAGCELARCGGRVALIQPLSLVAARDAAAVRSTLDRRADLRQLWVQDGSCFSAHVRVCCPVLEVRSSADTTPSGSPAARVSSWADRLADAAGVPRVDVRSSTLLSDRAEVAAGFRDEYYGLVPLVREASNGVALRDAADEPVEQPGGVVRPLITAGVLDWARSAWGDRPSRFARRQWLAPVVDTSRVPLAEPRGKAEARAAAWLARTAIPKVVVATQTRVTEAAVDESGAWVPSVPTLAVLPHRRDDLWLLAAAIASPTATAWLSRRAPGTALSAHALRITARDLAALPLPDDLVAWRAAAEALRAYAAAPVTLVASPEPVSERDGQLEIYCDSIARAYNAPRSLEVWWRDRGGPQP